MRYFRTYWPIVIVLTVAVELWAVSRHGPDDTMSEWVWSKIHSAPVRILLGAFLVWLIYHFLWSGPKRGLGWHDVAFLIVGAAMGFASYSWATR